MDQPENIHAETMEYAARLVEQSSFEDYAGVLSPKKRAREDAELRMRVRREQRTEMARFLRAMTNRPDLSAVGILRRIAEVDERYRFRFLSDAWPLAWKDWIRIEAILNCASALTETSYRITLTDKGRAVLSTTAPASDTEAGG